MLSFTYTRLGNRIFLKEPGEQKRVSARLYPHACARSNTGLRQHVPGGSEVTCLPSFPSKKDAAFACPVCFPSREKKKHMSPPRPVRIIGRISVTGRWEHIAELAEGSSRRARGPPRNAPWIPALLTATGRGPEPLVIVGTPTAECRDAPGTCPLRGDAATFQRVRAPKCS